MRLHRGFLAMMISCTIAISPLFASFNVASAGLEGPSRWIWLGGALLNDITCIDLNTCWAVGDHGLIIHTSDGGQTWEIQPSHTSAHLHRVQFLDAQIGWAVGHAGFGSSTRGGYVIHTTNGGEQWQIVDGPSQPELFMNKINDVCFADAQHGWVVGAHYWPYGKPVVSQTTDGGATWSMTLLDPEESEAAVGIDCSIPGRVWISTWSGHLFSWSEETGWVKRRLEDDGSSSGFYAAMDILFVDANRGWVTDLGRVWRTVDGGQTWTAASTLLELFGQRLIWVADRLWLAGVTADVSGAYVPQVLVSDDEGLTWEVEEVPINPIKTEQIVPRIGLTVLPSGEGWLASGFGALARRSSVGDWTLSHEGFDLTLRSYSFGSDWATLAPVGQHGIIVAGEGLSLWYSPGFGQPWQRIAILEPTLEPTEDVTQVQFVDSQHGWAITGYFATLWRTTDGGTSWARLRTWARPARVYFVTRDHGWAVERVGADTAVWVTTDGGQS